MKNNFQNPIEFETEILIDNVRIIYKNLMEIVQGGPVVGSLSIDNRPIPGCLFGGPTLYQNDRLYIPLYAKKKFLGWGFKLARIDINNLEIEFFGGIKSLIFLDKINNGRIYYFEDISKTRYSYYEI